MRGCTFGLAAVLVAALGASAAGVGIPVDGVTVTSADADSPYSRSATLHTITAGGIVYSEFVGVSPSGSSQTPSDGRHKIYWGAGDSNPGHGSTRNVLDGADITSGVLNPGSNGSGDLLVLFPRAVTDANGPDQPDVFLFNIDNPGSTESWTVTPYIGGIPGGRIEGGTPVSFVGTDMGDTGVSVTFNSNSGHNDVTQGNWGIGFDLAELGVHNLIGLKISTPDGDPSAAVGMPGHTAVQGITTESVDHGGYSTLDLSTVTVRRGHLGAATIDAADLNLVTLTRFNATASVTVLQALGGPAPSVQSRSALIEDLSLDTGIINPATGLGLTGPPDDSTPGMEVMFNHPLRNGPGPDFLVFEVQQNPYDEPDDFIVSPLDAGQPGRQYRYVYTDDYSRLLDDDAIAMTLYETSSPAGSLSDLEQGALSFYRNHSGSPDAFELFAVAIDLSDLGIPEWDYVDGLFFQSLEGSPGNFDPVLIAGLPNIPEPSSVVLLALGGLGLLAVARRRLRAR